MVARHRPGPARSDRCGSRKRVPAARAARRPRGSARRDAARGTGGVCAIPWLREDRMLVQQLPPNPRDHLPQACAALEIREHERPIAAHQLGVARHDVEAGADVRGEIDLVDHEQIGTRHARTSFARDLVAAGEVDDIDRRVDQLGTEAGRQVVAAGLQKHDVEIRVPFQHLFERVEVHRRILADRRMRTSARLDADDAIVGQCLAADQKLHVLAREDVVRDDAESVALAHCLAERIDERRLSGTDRTADADAKGTLAHDRNNLEWRYCCVIAETSIAGVNASGRARLVMASPTTGSPLSVLASRAGAFVWPICIDRSAADVVDASRVYAKAVPVSRMPTPAEAHAQPKPIGRPGPRRWRRARLSRCSSRWSGYSALHVVTSRSPIALFERRVAAACRLAVISPSNSPSAWHASSP